MAITETTVSFSDEALRAVQGQLRSQGVDGWLLCDFHGANPVAAGVLGLPALSRRYFVYLPATGRPIALTHLIEQQPWRGWIGENRTYLGWQSLRDGLASLLQGAATVACEYSPENGVPYLDLLPAGMLELIRGTGVRVVSSGELVSGFHSRWSGEGLASHRAAAGILRDVALEAFGRVGERLRAGETPDEWETRAWVLERLNARGLPVGRDSIVAATANGANPHYAPSAGSHRQIRAGDLLMIDLWGKQHAEAVYADQTWMAYVGDSVPRRIHELWTTIRDAREAAVQFIRDRWDAGEPIAGFEVDDIARGVVAARGHGGAFIHRTGHSIDRELHGSGPNIDNLETRDTRLLIQGVGFSIEPGVYYPGEVGLRTEIDVYMSESGPMVTTPDPQTELILVDAG